MKTCLNCSHFLNWDMDWCCTAQFKIISEIDLETQKTVNPENCIRDRSDCKDWENDSIDTTPIRQQFRQEEWEHFKP